MTTITLELPEQELKLFVALAEKLNARIININPSQKKESALYWLEKLQDVQSSIETPSEWQRGVRSDRILPFR